MTLAAPLPLLIPCLLSHWSERIVPTLSGTKATSMFRRAEKISSPFLNLLNPEGAIHRTAEKVLLGNLMLNRVTRQTGLPASSAWLQLIIAVTLCPFRVRSRPVIAMTSAAQGVGHELRGSPGFGIVDRKDI